LALFCGIRTEELTKLKWEHIKLDAAEPYVAIPAGIAKKRRIRHVPIPANAIAWLMCCPDRKGPITRQDFVTDFRKRFQRLLKASGFVEKDKEGKVVRIVWKRNAMRHSFGSYHYALHGDSLLTSRLLGHRGGDEILFAHYRDLAGKETAEKYFAILPSDKPGQILQLPKAKTA
jgi:integrase